MPITFDDHFYRHQYVSIVASLSRKVGVQYLPLIEDAAQSSLIKALTDWVSGLPENPEAWLHRVAFNQVIDGLRKQQGHSSFDEAFADTLDGAYDDNALVDSAIERAAQEVTHTDNDLLHLILICSDPAIPQKSSMVIVLKLLCGFSIKEISSRLFITEANSYKRYQRARDVLRQQAAYFNQMSKEDAEQRAESAFSVLYALFSEGYLSYSKDEAIRRDFCEEALRITEILATKLVTCRPVALALLSLMFLNVARLNSRLDAAGQLLLLGEQNREQWDTELIQLGFHYLGLSAQGELLSRYHLEAAIAAEHCRANSFETTDWEKICGYYLQLEHQHASYLYRLNRVVALAEWQGPEAALSLLLEIPPPTWMKNSYLWLAVAADLNHRCDQKQDAARYSDLAIKCAPNSAIQTLLARRLQQSAG